MLELIVLAATRTAVGVVKPVLPDVREFIRGTINIMENLLPFSALGLKLPEIRILINCMKYTRLARETYQQLEEIINDGRYSVHSEQIRVALLRTFIHDLEIYVECHAAGQPAHRLERKTDRVSDSALVTMSNLASELFPEWKRQFDRFVSKEMEAKHG